MSSPTSSPGSSSALLVKKTCVPSAERPPNLADSQTGGEGGVGFEARSAVCPAKRSKRLRQTLGTPGVDAANASKKTRAPSGEAPMKETKGPASNGPLETSATDPSEMSYTSSPYPSPSSG